ncbi:hypothetical protein HMPREF9612_02574 [Cutibacterium acnes HL063PA2]|nr:hypothetical protein HMPREF9612_02574 [Cutibacterium acnes HL063PA2]
MVVVIILSCVLHNLDCVGHIWGAELRFTQAPGRQGSRASRRCYL